jgi:hypothetical protein
LRIESTAFFVRHLTVRYKCAKPIDLYFRSKIQAGHLGTVFTLDPILWRKEEIEMPQAKKATRPRPDLPYARYPDSDEEADSDMELEPMEHAIAT